MAETYPKESRKPISILMNRLGVDEETAYAMLLMASLMTDLSPNDDRVIEIILKDCHVDP